MGLPKFLCIGAQKAGTSWLNLQLGWHPQIWLPPVKELHFFDHLYVEANQAWTHNHIRSGALAALQTHLARKAPADWGYIRYLAELADKAPFTEGWYRHAYDRPRARQRICGDVTPEYCMLPYEGIEHIKQLLPAVKLIYIVRDPVERALSQLRMHVERSKEEPNLQRLLKMCDDPDIDSRGDYLNHIPRWRRHFGPDELLVVPFGDIRNDPGGFLRRVESHLGVEPFDGYAFDKRVHESKKFDMPPEIVDLLTQRYSAQNDFLRSEFGDEFFQRTK